MSRQAVPRSPKSKRKTSPRPASSRPRLSWGGREWQMAGVLIVVLAALLLLVVLRLTPGVFSDTLATWLASAFGWGAAGVALAVAAAGYLLFRHGQGREIEVDW